MQTGTQAVNMRVIHV